MDNEQAVLRDADTAAAVMERLVARREALTLSHAQVAERMGEHEQTVRNMERVGADVRVSQLQRYARAVGAHLALTVDTANSPTLRPPVRRALLQFFTQHPGPRRIVDAARFIHSEFGYRQTSAKQVVSQLVQEGVLRRVDRGVYELARRDP